MAKRKHAAASGAIDAPYDYQAAGVVVAGMIHPLLRASEGDDWLGAIRMHLGREVRKITDGKGWGELETDILTRTGVIRFKAIAVQGLLRLADQAYARGRIDDYRSFLRRAALSWCLTEDEIEPAFLKSRAALAKQASANRENGQKRRRRVIQEIKRQLAARPKFTPDAIAQELAKAGGWGSLSTIRRDITAARKSGELPKDD